MTIQVGSGYDGGSAVVVDSKGRVIVVGYAYNGSDNDIAIVRYTSAGVLDASFGTNGIVTTAIGSKSS